MKPIIPIFFATDDNYATFLAIALQSIKENASKEYQYNIHVLHRGLSNTSTDMLDTFNDDNFKLFYDDVKECLDKYAGTLFVRDYYSKATYYRIFIPSIFPQYKKVLYLDCDIAVKGDISELYNTEIGDNYVGAITDEAVGNVPEFSDYVEKFLGVSQPNYFNAGILVINLEKLREDHFDEKFLDLISKYKFIVAQDQDYLNVLCKDKVTYISKVWNKQPMPDDNLSLDNIKLIHYNLSFKPWHYDNILYQEVFWKYVKQIGLYDKINQMLIDFTDEHKQKDQQGGANLIKLAGELSKDANRFNDLVERNVINLN